VRIKKILKSFAPDIGKNNETSREKWLEHMLLAVPKSSRILDAGAGTQRYRKYCNHLEYVSQDFGRYDGKGDEAALQTGEFEYGELDIVSDIASIPESDSSFDAVMCIEVLEHLPDPVQAVKEFSRLLKSNGHLIITAPFCSLTHFAPYHFCSGFNRYWFERHLPEHGFKNVRIDRNGNFFEYVAQEIYRIPSISGRYSKGRPNLLELFGMFMVQRMLSRFSRSDEGSSELLCFGYHVHARKV
jgi:ubiquinone/menaquinone biosynthesis C-methylase UbiE